MLFPRETDQRNLKIETTFLNLKFSLKKITRQSFNSNIFSGHHREDFNRGVDDESQQHPSITNSLKSENIYEPQIVSGGGGPRSLTGGTRV